ncbi:MAG: glycosyltransferase family 4 protein [Desulfobacteraceae bacterium]|nr:glycosyltransferase family 4 protein [Desulfobacteraceae bacterium]
MENNKIYIAAEYILPNCGLGNYLELLVSALNEQRPDIRILVKTDENVWVKKRKGFAKTNKEVKIVISSLEKRIKNVIKPICPRKLWEKMSWLRAIVFYTMYHRRFYTRWRQVSDDEICILPHIPLSKVLVPYYKELAKKKLIWVVHDLHPFYFPDAWNSEALKLCKTLLPILADKAKHIIVHNRFTLESVVKHLGISKDKISVIRLPHILDLQKQELSNQEANQVLAKYGIQHPYALWASSTTILHKNHERLIKSWVKVQKNYDKVIQLVCSGAKEPNWSQISRVLQKVDDKVDVVFTGSIAKDHLITLLKNAHLAVCPTLFEGGGCGPALEAASTRIPVACSDIPQIREQYDNRGDLCIYFDPKDENSIADAVLYLLHHYDTAKKMAERALGWTKHRRSWAEVAKEYWAVIDQFI